MLQVRHATPPDLPRILDITNDAIATSTALWMLRPTTLETHRAWFEHRQSSGFPVLVVADASGVVAFGALGPFRPYDGFRHTVEHSLYVDRPARGHGAGRMLLAALESEARHLRMHVMIGAIEAGNTVSLALHRRAGFVETGRLREVGRKFDRWLDLVLMQKLLGSEPDDQ